MNYSALFLALALLLGVPSGAPAQNNNAAAPPPPATAALPPVAPLFKVPAQQGYGAGLSLGLSVGRRSESSARPPDAVMTGFLTWLRDHGLLEKDPAALRQKVNGRVDWKNNAPLFGRDWSPKPALFLSKTGASATVTLEGR